MNKPKLRKNPNTPILRTKLEFEQTQKFPSNFKNMKNKVFLGFHLEDVIGAIFHGRICNQQIEIRKYTKF